MGITQNSSHKRSIKYYILNNIFLFGNKPNEQIFEKFRENPIFKLMFHTDATTKPLGYLFLDLNLKIQRKFKILILLYI
jgi:hypothetical protein